MSSPGKRSGTGSPAAPASPGQDFHVPAVDVEAESLEVGRRRRFASPGPAD